MSTMYEVETLNQMANKAVREWKAQNQSFRSWVKKAHQIRVHNCGASLVVTLQSPAGQQTIEVAVAL